MKKYRWSIEVLLNIHKHNVYLWDEGSPVINYDSSLVQKLITPYIKHGKNYEVKNDN